jgi:hypothetical protein
MFYVGRVGLDIYTYTLRCVTFQKNIRTRLQNPGPDILSRHPDIEHIMYVMFM